jgi:hypothetical protein
MDEEQTGSIKIIQCKISKSDLDQLDNPQTTQEHIIINDSNLKSENYFYNENKLLKSNLSFNENQINSLKEQLFILTEQNQKIKQESSLLSNTISSQTNLIEHLKEQNLELTNKLNTQNTTITQLNQKLNENLTIIQSHQSQINSLNMELLSLKQGLGLHLSFSKTPFRPNENQNTRMLPPPRFARHLPPGGRHPNLRPCVAKMQNVECKIGESIDPPSHKTNQKQRRKP